MRGRERKREGEEKGEKKLEKRLARRCRCYNDSPLPFALDAPLPHIPSRYFCSEGPCYSFRGERGSLFNAFRKCIYIYIYIYIKLYSCRVSALRQLRQAKASEQLFCFSALEHGVFSMQQEIGRRRWHVVKKRQNSFPSAAFKARPRGCRRSAGFVLRFRVKNRTARVIAAAEARAPVSCVVLRNSIPMTKTLERVRVPRFRSRDFVAVKRGSPIVRQSEKLNRQRI